MSAPLVMLHLGLGFFHRAHQALYLHRLIDSGDSSWVLAGGNIRPDMLELMASLAAQGGAYTLETVTPDGERSYVKITAIKTVVPYDPSLAGLITIGADSATRIISFTVTEAGYYLDAKNRLDLSFADLATDVAAAREGKPGGTIYAALTAILRERMRRSSGKVTLLNCDNLRHNGERFRGGLLQFIALLNDSALHDWVMANTSSPNAMVDRITPRPTTDVAERVKSATGWDDAAPVMSESFIQWVIEDDFCNGRPAWERVGVEMVESVNPYEEAKIRILNASHSTIAWAGTLVGYQFVHEGTRDPAIRQIARDYVSNDVIPCLSTPEHPGPIDLPAYRDVVLERFSNPAIRDSNQRVAMDGYSKIPGFIAPTVRERLAQDASIGSVAMLPALFLAFLQRWHRGEIPYTYHDQAMDPAAAHAVCQSSDPVDAFCRDPVLWGPLAGDQRLVREVRAAGERVATFVREHQAMTRRLEDRHAMLTGAAGGIGLAVTAAYLAHGARCTAVDVASRPSRELAALMAQHGDRLQYVACDVSKTAQVDQLIAAAQGRFGPVDILFNNAAVFDLAPLLESDEAMYDRLFAVNVRGMFFVMQKVLAQMVAQRADSRSPGTVINLASQAGRRGEALVSHYCATKAAVVSYTQSAALAMAPYGIRVNAIAPGVIDTPMWQQVDALFARYEGLQPGEKKAAVGRAVPLGYMGRPDQVAGAAVFLASDEASYITAQTLNVDGGNVMS